MKAEDPGPLPAGSVSPKLRANCIQSLERALQSMRRAIAIRPGYRDALVMMDLFTRELADFREAKAEYDRDMVIAETWAGRALKAKLDDPPSRVRNNNGKTVNAAPIVKTAPAYPPDAVAAQIKGDVELIFTIDPKGRPKNVQVLSGHPALRSAAIEALNNWVYRPTLLNGDPIEIISKATINFPPATPSAPRRMRVGSPVIQAKLITKVDPVYPPAAAKAHIEGAVELEFGIDETGHVEGIKVISGHPLLAPAAVETLSKWVYRPTMLNGEPVAIQGGRVTIKFPSEKE